MNAEQRYYKLVSLLMRYPDAVYWAALPTVLIEVERLPADPPKKSLRAFVDHLETSDRLRLQEDYTALFDLNPSTSLNLSYHLWGDGEKRARLMTELQQLYGKAGLEKNTSELPDYLPLVLEFVATVPTARQSTALQACWAGLTQVVDRLRENGPPYAALLAALIDSLREADMAATIAHSDALDRQGGRPDDETHQHSSVRRPPWI
jgi:nitrate reductase molybdenum cofactor assembly chaperone NarJ/NarW